MQGAHRSGGAGKSPLCDPGSELRQRGSRRRKGEDNIMGQKEKMKNKQLASSKIALNRAGIHLHDGTGRITFREIAWQDIIMEYRQIGLRQVLKRGLHGLPHYLIF